MRSRATAGGLVALLIVGSALGCGTTRARSTELARVAKDWCLTIRASQVIPVYPLSEDVEVGDVYLVRTRIEDQVAVYKAKGFLPLENLVARVPPRGFATFYRGGYGVGAGRLPPRVWQFPTTRATTRPTDYLNAPRAAFPSYQFQVRRGQGLALAVPVQGVPVGLSLLNTASASGSVLITDAVTYGVDMASLQAQVDEWAASNRDFLAQFEPVENEKSPGRHYLRVVSRVYLVGRVSVALLNDEARGAKAEAGNAPPIDLTGLASQNSEANLSGINKALAGAVDMAPGGSLKLTAASSRSVSLDETFPRPLVIGYIGFDLPILKGGQLGAPVPTQQRLLGRPALPAKPVPWGPDANSARIESWLRGDPQRVAQVRQFIEEQGVQVGVTNVLQGGPYRDLRGRIVEQFQIP